MKIPYLFALIFYSFTIFSGELIWKSNGAFISLHRDSNNYLFSKGCKQNKCMALDFTKNLSFKKLEKNQMSGGKNPGAVLCLEVLKQQVVYLKDVEGNENSFCFFKDRSLISNSSLYDIAYKNDLKNKGKK